MTNADIGRKHRKSAARKEDDGAMHESIYQFIHAHYTEILAVFPQCFF